MSAGRALGRRRWRASAIWRISRPATTASVSLDGVMVALRAGEDGRGALLARGRLRHGLLPRRRRRTAQDALSRPHARERQAHAEGATRKRGHVYQAGAPRYRDRALADGAPDNWTFLETLAPEVQAVDFWHACEHLRTASDHAVDPRWFETYRHILRHDPRGSTRVIRALRYLRDGRRNRNAIERELAFSASTASACPPSARGVAIGSGVSSRQGRLVTQRMKRSGMRWSHPGGQYSQSAPSSNQHDFDRACDSPHAR